MDLYYCSVCNRFLSGDDEYAREVKIDTEELWYRAWVVKDWEPIGYCEFCIRDAEKKE